MTGNDPNPFTLVSCANIGSRKHSPSRIIPHRGQVSENDSKSPESESWAVFHKRKSRSYFANDASHLAPESGAFSVDAFAVCSACGTDVLTRESSRHNVNSASPDSAIERRNVIPDRECVEASIGLSCEQDASGVGINLNSADGAPSKQLPSQDAASCPCK
jgi:hypothetical protein